MRALARFLSVIAVILFLGVIGGAWAAENPLRVDMNAGVLVRLPAPASSVFVADPAVADIQVLSPTMVSVFGKAPGETSIVAVDAGEQVILDRRVAVVRNLASLNRAIADLLPRAEVLAKPVKGGILLTGRVSTPDQAEDARRLAARFVKDEDIINRIRIDGPTQIHLRVRVAEVSRDVSKQFGINWEALGRSGDFVFGLANGDDIRFDEAGNLIRTPSSNNLLAQFRSAALDVNLLVDALAAEGLITVMAEPSLTAVSGETARFLAGGEFPIPLAGSDGDLTVQFKEFGVSLAFTPTLIGEGRINLRVRPEVSQLSSSGAVRVNDLDIPALTTRRAETTVELGSGQSFAIAGLLQNNGNQTIRKFPLLGDIPVLGGLFRSSRFQRNESELVIIVTPYLVEPVSTPLASPTDGLRPADDWERVVEGRFIDASPAGLSQASPRQPVGYVVE